MLHSSTRDIIVKTSLEGNEDDTLAPGDRVAGLIHVSVLNDVRIKTLAVSSVGFEITYGKRNISLAHPMRTLAAITHIPATVKDVKVFYARRTVVLEDSVLPCGSHTYSFRTRLPTTGLEPTLDTGLVGVHYGITTMVTLPNGENISSQCGFRVGSIIGARERVSTGESSKHGVRVRTRAEIMNRRDLNVILRAEREGRLDCVPEPKRAKTKFKRMTFIGVRGLGNDTEFSKAEEYTVSEALIPIGFNVDTSMLLRMAFEGQKLIPTIPPGRAQLFSIGYNVKCKVQFERHKIKRPSSITVSVPIFVPDEARTTHMNGILGPDGIPIITQVTNTTGVKTNCNLIDNNPYDDTEEMDNSRYQTSNDVLGMFD